MPVLLRTTICYMVEADNLQS